MIELVKITNGVASAYSREQFRGDYHTTGTSDSIMNPHGVYRVDNLPAPQVDTGYKAVSWGFPQQVNGFWTGGWDVVALDADEARKLRTSLLSATDWTQLADADANAATWVDYRQSLRDITDQAGFPNEVTWPNKPE